MPGMKRPRIDDRVQACTATYVDHFLHEGVLNQDEAGRCLTSLGSVFPLFNTLMPLDDNETNEIRDRARRDAKACSDLKWAADMRDRASRREFLETLQATYLSRQLGVCKTMQPEDHEWVWRMNTILWCESHFRVLRAMEQSAWCPEYQEWSDSCK